MCTCEASLRTRPSRVFSALTATSPQRRKLVEANSTTSLARPLRTALSNVQLEMVFGMWRFTASVKDDGVGIDPDLARLGGPEGHWGLIGMRERAMRIGGQLKISRRPSGGTEV